ncbi:hypothetical protein [Demequina mangrovi]|uniref:Uncharacterized protein n=1 Tax=Demequina mangrovi TaxID=1043493 RepID=A0A1H6ZBQ4_9MICO|nr:hypothetical protein [Demequina mangrovi]SEJ50861.1 hypothetical protein SAMN05421637_2069 [Demequina mangrovi]
MFVGLTPEICAQAWELVKPAIATAAARGVIRDAVGDLVVMDPARPGTMLWSGSIGDTEDKTYGYAVAKAKVAERAGLDTSRVRMDAPHLYTAGDIVYPGGVVRHGLVVAFSGVEGEADEMIAEWFIAAVRGIARLAFVSPHGPDATGTRYLGA